MRRFAILVATAALPGLTATVAADVPRDEPAAIEVDREIAPPGRAELGFDAGGAIDGWAASVSFGYLRRPIALRSNLGESAPVTRRATVAIGAALALGESGLIDIRFPVAWQEGDRLKIAGDPRGLDRWVPGDLRVGGRVRVVGTPRGSAFIRAEASFPTGDARDFAGEASWSLAWSLIGRAELPAGISLAVSGGIRLRGAEVLIADRLVGDELFGGLGILVPVPPIRPLWCVRDQVKLTAEIVGILGDDVANKSGPSPAEGRIGIVTRPLPDLALGVRVGAGLSDEIGTPRWRATIELTYQGHGRVIPRSTKSADDDDDPDASDLTPDL